MHTNCKPLKQGLWLLNIQSQLCFLKTKPCKLVILCCILNFLFIYFCILWVEQTKKKKKKYKQKTKTKKKSNPYPIFAQTFTNTKRNPTPVYNMNNQNHPLPDPPPSPISNMIMMISSLN